MSLGSRRLARGFTLMEVMLVLIVGAALLGGGTLLYNQLRENAGAAAANTKALQLQGLVEKLVASNGGDLPTATALRAAWEKSRSDFQTSPWGAKAQCRSSDNTNLVTDTSSCYDGIRLKTVCLTAAESRCFDNDTIAGDSGVLVYLRYADRQGRFRTFLDVWDNTQKLYVHTSRFAVAAENPDGRQFYFVHGPPDLAADTGRPRAPDGITGKGDPRSCNCNDAAIEIGDKYGR